MRHWLWAGLVAAAPAAAGATTIIALPEAELVRAADTIVLGTVIDTTTVIDAGGRVATRARLQVYRHLRGAGAGAGEVLTVEVPGGTLKNGLVAHTPGSPALAGGDFVFGFFETTGEVKRPLGLSYGLLRVRRAADGSWRVFRETDGLTMLSPQGGAAAEEAVALRDVPLATLVARIAARLTELGLPPGGAVAP